MIFFHPLDYDNALSFVKRGRRQITVQAKGHILFP